MLRSIILGVVLFLGVSTALSAQHDKPTRPTEGVTKTGDWNPGGMVNSYCCNTGQRRNRARNYSHTFVLAEYSSICNAICARCECAGGAHKGQRRDSGEGDHSLEVSLNGAVESANKMTGQAGLKTDVGDIGGSVESALSQKFGGDAKVTLGAKNTHAGPCEKLDFYGFISITIQYQVIDYTFLYSGWEVYDSSKSFLLGVTVTVENGYDVIPCSCPPSTQTSGVFRPVGDFVATTTIFVKSREPMEFPTGTTIVVNDRKKEKEDEPTTLNVGDIAKVGIPLAGGGGVLIYKLVARSGDSGTFADPVNLTTPSGNPAAQFYEGVPKTMTTPEGVSRTVMETVTPEGETVAQEMDPIFTQGDGTTRVGTPAVAKDIADAESVAVRPVNPDGSTGEKICDVGIYALQIQADRPTMESGSTVTVTASGKGQVPSDGKFVLQMQIPSDAVFVSTGTPNYSQEISGQELKTGVPVVVKNTSAGMGNVQVQGTLIEKRN